jgi:hypothetical protein
MRIHKREIVSPYYEDLKSGRKKFEIRRRPESGDFWVGDILELTHEKSGGKISCKITYIYIGEYGLQPGHAILGVEIINGKEESTTAKAAAAVDSKGTPAVAGNANVLAGEPVGIRRAEEDKRGVCKCGD